MNIKGLFLGFGILTSIGFGISLIEKKSFLAVVLLILSFGYFYFSFDNQEVRG